MGRDAQLIVLLLLVLGVAGLGVYLYLTGDSTEPSIKGDGSEIVTTDFADKSTEARRAPSESRVSVEPPTARTETNLSSTTEALPLTSTDGPLAAVRGTVDSSAGRVVQGALVALCEDISDVPSVSLQGRRVASAETDAKGQYTITGINPEYRYMMRVEHAEFASAMVGKIELRAGESQVVNVSLKTGILVTGTVTDLEDRPIAGADVQILDQNAHSADPADAVERSVTTDENGVFELNNINVGYKKVIASASGYSTFTNHGVLLRATETPAPLKFRLSVGSFLAGRVVDQDDQPVADAMIIADSVRTSVNSPTLGNHPPIKSKEDGTFRYEGLMPGTYQLTCRKGGYDSQNAGIKVTARTEQEDVVIKLQRAPVIRGSVIDADTGAPVRRFSIQMGRGDTLVFSSVRLTQRFESEAGEFSYRCEALGEVTLFAEAQGYAGGKSEKLNVLAGQDLGGVVIRMSRGAVVRGRILDAEGAGVGGAEVELLPQLGDDLQNSPFHALLNNAQRSAKKTTRTDAAGNYVVQQVAENSFKVRASHKEFATTESDRSIRVPGSGEMEFSPLTLMRGGRLTGTIYDADGKEEAMTKVNLVEKGQFGGTSYSAVSDNAGRFEISRIRPGIYRVNVMERRGEVSMDIFKDILSGKQPLEVIIEEGGTVNVEVR